MSEKSRNRTMTVSQCAEQLGISRTTAYKYLGQLADSSTETPFKVLRIGRTLRVVRASFERYLAENHANPEGGEFRD